MAFSVKDTINKILSYKNDWDKASTAKDETGKQQAASNAQKYYNQLKGQGYDNVAENLSQKNTVQAKSYADTYYKTAGNTEFRPYVYNLGRKYGLSNKDVDKYISWNNDTGEISLGGKNIGRPAGVVNGRSYVNNTADIDRAFEEAMRNSGITPSVDTMYNQSLHDTQNKISEQWDTIKNDKGYVRGLIDNLMESANADPLKTDWGKALMDGYSYKGQSAASNAAAKAAEANGGNIDSYAAANAARQQAAYIDQGMRRVMDYNDSRLSRVQQIIDQYSGYANNAYAAQNNNISSGVNASQQMFDNNEAAKNNDVARKVQKANITGYAPDEWINEQTNPYFDENGNLINPDIDYQEQINNVEKKLKTVTDPEEKSALQATLYNLRNARIKKATSIPEYEKWIGTLESNGKEKTAALKENDSNNATTLAVAQTSADAQADAADKSAQAAMYGDMLNYQSKQDELQSAYDTAIDSAKIKAQGNSGNDNNGALKTSELANNAKSINNTFGDKVGGDILVPNGLSGTYKLSDNLSKKQKKEYAEYIISSIYAASDLTTEQKIQMIYAYGLDSYYNDIVNSGNQAK